MSKDIFKQAAKTKLRFQTNAGALSQEDLWDLPIETVDNLYMLYKAELDVVGAGSLIKKRTSNTVLKLRCEVAKAIVEQRLADADRREKTVARRARNEKIREVIFNKENQELLETDKADLYKMLDEDDEMDGDD